MIRWYKSEKLIRVLTSRFRTIYINKCFADGDETTKCLSTISLLNCLGLIFFRLNNNEILNSRFRILFIRSTDRKI